MRNRPAFSEGEARYRLTRADSADNLAVTERSITTHQGARVKTPPVRTHFGPDYYRRFYESPETRAAGPDDTQKLVGFVAAYLEHLRVPVRSVLDMGCGLGLWRPPLAAHYPDASYTGVEVSDCLCNQYGWTRGSVTNFRSRRKFDLVICQSVLQYVRANDVRTGVRNLARWCRGALYLEIVTREDWDHNCDHSATDGAIHLRKADWYRQVIRPHFVGVGGGIYLPRQSPVVLYELERT